MMLRVSFGLDEIQKVLDRATAGRAKGFDSEIFIEVIADEKDEPKNPRILILQNHLINPRDSKYLVMKTMKIVSGGTL